MGLKIINGFRGYRIQKDGNEYSVDKGSLLITDQQKSNLTLLSTVNANNDNSESDR